MNPLKLIALGCFALIVLAHPAEAGLFGVRGNGQKTTETRLLQGFKKLELRAPLDVKVHQGKAFAVSLTTDSNLMPLITTQVRGDVLEVSTKSSVSGSKGPNVLDVTLPDLRGIQISGSGDVDVSGFQDAVDRTLEVAGSGDIVFSGSAAKLKVAIDGSGNVKLKGGSAQALSLEVNGSGDVGAKDFKVQDAAVEVSGSGDVELTLTGGNLQASVNGSGDVTWHGTAKSVAAAKHGSGEITHAD